MLKTEYIRVPYCKSIHGQEEVDAVIKCLSESTQMGKYTRLFEREIAKLFSKEESLFVNSGSSANLLALSSLEIERSSEIITPCLTFATTIAPILQLSSSLQLKKHNRVAERISFFMR